MSPEANPSKPSLNPNFFKAINPLSNIEVIEQELRRKPVREGMDDLSRHGGLDTELAQAYGIDYMQYFSAPDLPAANNVASRSFDDYRRIIAAQIIDDNPALLRRTCVDEKYIKRFPNDSAVNLMLAARSGEKQLEAYFKSPLGKEWFEEIESSKHYGFLRSGVVSLMYDRTVFDFYPESGYASDTLAVNGLTQGDLAYIYRNETAPPDVKLFDVALHRRELGNVDLSKQVLDNRSAVMLNAMNAEYSCYILGELRDMACMGGPRETRALEIYDTHKEAILGADLLSKIAVMDSVARAYKDFALYARGGRHVKTAKAFDAMSERAISYNVSLGTIAGTMKRIYGNCHYEAPTGLNIFIGQPEAPQDTTANKNTAPDTVPETDEATSPETPQAIEAPEEQIAINGTADAVAKRLLEGLMVEQLDEVLLPTDPEKFRDQLKEAITKTSRGNEELKGKVWEKVIDIATVCVEYGGKMYRSKRGSASLEDIDRPDLTDEERERLSHRKSPPYFVAVFERPGSRSALAETEEYGYATRFVDEASLTAGKYMTWLDALRLRRKEAERTGVQRIVHSRGDNHFGPAHQQKMRAMLEQHDYTKKTS